MGGGVGPVPGTSLPGAAPRETRQRVREAARGLEAVLLRQLISSMERAQLEGGFFGRSAGSGARQTTFELLLSRALAESEPLGLAEKIAEQLVPGGDGGERLRRAAALAGEALPAGLLDGRPPFSGNFRVGTQGGGIPAEEKGGERLPSSRPRED